MEEAQKPALRLAPGGLLCCKKLLPALEYTLSLDIGCR
jgi:hypothetical protein